MFDIQAQGSFSLRSLNFSTVTSTNVSAILILAACLVLLFPGSTAMMLGYQASYLEPFNSFFGFFKKIFLFNPTDRLNITKRI